HSGITTRKDTRHVTTRRHQSVNRVLYHPADDTQPGMVQRPVDWLRLPNRELVASLQNLRGGGSWQSIQDGQPVALLGAMREHALLYLHNRFNIRLATRLTQAHRIGHCDQIEVSEGSQSRQGILQCHGAIAAQIGTYHVAADTTIVEESVDGIFQIAFTPA